MGSRVKYGFLGGGKQADEIEDYLDPAHASFRAVSREYLDPRNLSLIDITTRQEEHLSTPVIAAVGAPGLKRKLVNFWAGKTFLTYVAGFSSVSPSATIGDGCVIAPGAIITNRVTLGRHVMINVSSSISHDTVIDDYCTVSPGARIAGSCRLAAGVFVGVGANVAHEVSITEGAIIGAGATVLSDVTVRGLYVGTPARRVRESEEWLYEL
ncbi:acetyltransferase [Lysinibacter sp. HNR]|uniref:acetyltransferase n=1 Tax=Lysinibacter sp. HNR TaxID=3031408 RepID=UPI0024359E9E|nr:acetyltransferase [Lysinibacter sp. HNR]WGD38071.1 acetyltransferase [Lysinibacter sp. HNR]